MLGPVPLSQVGGDRHRGFRPVRTVERKHNRLEHRGLPSPMLASTRAGRQRGSAGRPQPPRRAARTASERPGLRLAAAASPIAATAVRLAWRLRSWTGRGRARRLRSWTWRGRAWRLRSGSGRRRAGVRRRNRRRIRLRGGLARTRLRRRGWLSRLGLRQQAWDRVRGAPARDPRMRGLWGDAHRDAARRRLAVRRLADRERDAESGGEHTRAREPAPRSCRRHGRSFPREGECTA